MCRFGTLSPIANPECMLCKSGWHRYLFGRPRVYMKTTSVLHVLPRLSCGGAEWMAVNLMANLDRTRFTVSVLSLAGPMGSALEDALAAKAVPMYYLGKHPGFDPRMFTRVDRFLRE